MQGKTTLREKKLITQSRDFYTHIKDNTPSEYHTHNFYEIFYVTEGVKIHMYNGKKEYLNVGDLLIIRPGDWHGFLVEEGRSGKHRDIVVSKKLFEKTCSLVSQSLLQNIIDSYKYAKVNVHGAKINELENIVEKAQFGNEIGDKYRDAYSVILLVHILQAFVEKGIDLTTKYPTWLRDLLVALKEPISFPYTMEEILSNYYFDRSYMRKVFKKHIGCTMTEYRLNAKLDYADMLLKTTTFNIEKIAQTCGFNNPTYFYRTYKQKFGHTPKH